VEPITQGLLGAATGHLVAGRQVGRRALLFGALVAMSPDLDVVLAPLHSGFGEWLYHRGTTHSLWFGFVVGPGLGWLLWRWQDPDRETDCRAWIGLAVVALVTHPILDGFTPYGTQFFAPFSRVRFAWNGVAIVDPIYSGLLGAGVWFAASNSRPVDRGRAGILLGLALSCLYLYAGLAANHWTVKDLRSVFEREPGSIARVRAYPTIAQPWLRHFVVHIEDRRYVGFHSLLTPGCPAWRVHQIPASDPRIESVLQSWQGQLLDWFADGDIGIEERSVPSGTVIRIEDLRYAWSDSRARGMWGIEARFDARGELQGPIRRFARRNPAERDLTHLWQAILGRLPGPAEGWTQPSACDAPHSIGSGHDGIHDDRDRS